jgi:hypothetical protein
MQDTAASLLIAVTVFIIFQGWDTSSAQRAAIAFNFEAPLPAQVAALHSLLSKFVDDRLPADAAVCAQPCPHCKLELPASLAYSDLVKMCQVAQERALAWNEDSHASAMFQLFHGLLASPSSEHSAFTQSSAAVD